MRGKNEYEELREVFMEFKKKEHFQNFSSADLFYIFDSNDNHVLLTFIDQFYGEAYGLQCFYNRNGFNYVHDILSCKNEETVTVGDCDSIVAVFKSKENLTEEDSEFLKAMGMRKVKENNLIVYRFEKGYRSRTAKPKEITTISIYAVFLASLLNNEYQDITECFNEGNCVFASLNLEAMEYSCIYRPLPFLEDNPHRSPVNAPFVEEYSNRTYLNEDCYLYTTYLPVSVKETHVRPMILYFYFEHSDIIQLKYIMDAPKEYKNCIYGILDDIFTNVGLPARMIINNRDIYHIITKTLDALHIENVFQRDNDAASEDVAPLLQDLYSKTLDSEVESSETISMVMDVIANTMDQMSGADFDFEAKESEDFVS